jgi:chromosome segregation ATPase
MEDVMLGMSRRLAWSVAVVLTVGGSAALVAQGKPETADAGPLAVLTAEIRQLRLAVEESARTQTQAQSLGVYLSAQQARVTQVAGRLDTAREHLNSLTAVARDLSAKLSTIETELRNVTEPELRSELEAQRRALRQELGGLAEQVQAAQSREAELSQMLQVEDSRWSEIITRLEQLVKK